MSTPMMKLGVRGWSTWSELLKLGMIFCLVAALLLGRGYSRLALAQDRSAHFARFDVTLTLQQDGSFRVTERQQVVFVGGAFSNGFREISRTRTDDIRNVAVAELEDGVETPYRYVDTASFKRAPGTYTVQDATTQVRLDWSFPPTADAERTFLVEYDVFGAVRVYDDADPPFQEIYWTAIGSELTENVPVRAASLTINLPEPVALSEINYMPENEEPAESNGGRTWTWTASNLSGGESLVAGLRFAPMVEAQAPSWQAAEEQAQRDAERDETAGLHTFVAVAVATLIAVMSIVDLWEWVWWLLP